jgi:hypothetical protein|tara:strand:+ start:496 stop:597 length:102 start_codon:yes stop_codon:yes gene_type:complete
VRPQVLCYALYLALFIGGMALIARWSPGSFQEE